GERARNEAEEEAQRDDVLELEPAREIAPEHRPHRPQQSGAGRLGDHDRAFRRRVERMSLVHEPEAHEGGEEEPHEACARPLAQQESGAGDRDQRLHLLDHDGRDEVRVSDERVGEEDRGDGRRAGADHDRRGDVAAAGAEDGAQRGEEQRQRQQDEDHVLAEDDRRRRRRPAHRLADDRVRAPHRGGDRDEHDSGNRGETAHQTPSVTIGPFLTPRGDGGMLLLMADTTPAIRYARSGDVHVAYQVVGDGPVDIVFVEGFVTNRHVVWEEPSYRRFVERLGSFARVILFDKRGMGLSDRVQAGTLEERMDDVRAVMDAVGSERAALIGESEGGPMSMLFAASFPQRTVALLLCGAEVKEETTEDWPWGESTREEFEEDMVGLLERWSSAPSSLKVFVRDWGDDPQVLEWFARLKVQSASPAAAETFMRMAHDIDVRDVAPAIRVPTLILHSVEDQICHVENARFLARTIPGARYVELPGA